MPTASTAQILSNAECIEPYKFCVYTRRVNSGEFVVVNKHMHKDLMSNGYWTDDIKRQIIRDRGSIQKVAALPLDIRDRYMTAFEISKKTILDMSQDRGAFIDQTQSLNIFLSEPNSKVLTNILIGGWKRGLKTGMYYLKRQPIQHPIQYTVGKGLTVSKNNSMEDEACTSCSA